MAAIVSLAVEQLCVWRGERMLFHNLAFSVGSAQVLALEGPNGAGKTSLLRALAGFLEPRAGTITIRTDDGAAVTAGEERARYIGWLGHQDGSKPQMTARETLRFYASYYEVPHAVDAALETVGLKRLGELPVQYLSAGQKRRLGLARLLLCARPVWLLDEPLAALDQPGKALVARLIAEHCRMGGLAIAATHDPLGLEALRLTVGSVSS